VLPSKVLQIQWHNTGNTGNTEIKALLLAVTLHVAADHTPVENIKRGKERRCAVTLVISTSQPGSLETP